MIFLQNNSIHGLKYVFESERHWTERVLWTILCCMSGYGAVALARASWLAFKANAVSFVVDTSHLNWNTTFPAVSICEQKNEEKIKKLAIKLFGAARILDHDAFLEEIVYFNPMMCGTCSQTCGSNINCTIDFQYAISKVRAPCKGLFKYCAWNEKVFECCNFFSALETEVGTCYTINSLQHLTSNKRLSMISNRFLGPGKLELRLFENAQVYLHGADEVPYINHPLEEQFYIELGQAVKTIFLIRELENDKFLESVAVEQRDCRWHYSENILSTHSYYSYSTCTVDCRARAQMKICHCVSQFMPQMGKFPVCDLKGLICLQENKDDLNQVKTTISEARGLICDCMPSCSEPELSIVETSFELESMNNTDNTLQEESIITIEMESLPTAKYNRKLVRSPLDLIVSVGGIIGLFLGTSIMTTLETVFLLCIRKPTFRRSNQKCSKACKF